MDNCSFLFFAVFFFNPESTLTSSHGLSYESQQDINLQRQSLPELPAQAFGCQHFQQEQLS